jgi:hypothetical protein
MTLDMRRMVTQSRSYPLSPLDSSADGWEVPPGRPDWSSGCVPDGPNLPEVRGNPPLGIGGYRDVAEARGNRGSGRAMP